jgi:hypothetical protein
VERPDRLALLAAIVLATVALVVGVRTSNTVEDVDEAAFHQTLVEMRAGTGYYDALRDGLAAKEGRPPSQIRSYRLPTLYLGLALLPEGAWRWATGLPVAVLLVSAWAIGRRLHAWGALVAVMLVGAWAIAAAPYLYLHAELWGAAALLAGLALLQRDRVGATAASFAVAALLRELYLLAFLFGFLRHRRALSWWLAAVAVGTLAIVHIHLARQVLEPRGLEAPLRLATSDIPAALSPSGTAIGIAVGLVGLVLGAAGLVQGVRAGHAAAEIAVAHSLVLLALTLRFGHTYWGLTFGPSVAAFAGGSLDGLEKIVGHRSVAA